MISPEDFRLACHFFAELLCSDLTGEQQRQRKTKNTANDHLQHRVLQRAPKRVIAHQLGVGCNTDEFFIGCKAIPVKQAGIECVDGRVEEKYYIESQHRSDKKNNHFANTGLAWSGTILSICFYSSFCRYT